MNGVLSKSSRKSPSRKSSSRKSSSRKSSSRKSPSKSTRKNSPNTINRHAINLDNGNFKINRPEMSPESIFNMATYNHNMTNKDFNKGKKILGETGPIDPELIDYYYNEEAKKGRNNWREAPEYNKYVMGKNNTYGLGLKQTGYQLSPQTRVPRTPPEDVIRKTKKNNQNPRVPDNKSIEDKDPINVFNRLTQKQHSPIKSKGGKSKIKSCCSVRKSAKVCRRKTDNKKFSLPRRFSRKTCLSKKPRGFTMRSSCAPYKGCKKTKMKKSKKGGRKRPNKKNTVVKYDDEEELSRAEQRVPDGIDFLNNEENDGGPMMVTMNTPIQTPERTIIPGTPPNEQQRGIVRLNADNFVPDTPVRERIEQLANHHNIQYRDLLNNLLESGQLDRPPARIEVVPGLTRMIRQESIENLADAVRERRLPIVDVHMSDVSEPPSPQTTRQSDIVINTNTRRRRRSRTPTTRRTRTRRSPSRN